jgi:transglutaminase superfamily protein
MTARTLRLCVLTAHAWILLASFDLARRAGFARTCERLRRLNPATRKSWAHAEDVVWAVDEACVWYVKRAACLQRSVVATRLLRRHGLRAEMVIGYRPLPFESHAWVEVDGNVLNDRPQYQKAFTVLDRI